MATSSAAAPPGSAATFTVQDAIKMRASQLHLMHRKLAAVPAGVAALSRLTTLDLSENPLRELAPAALPCNLKELVLAGCQLSGTLPHSLTRLTALQHLVLAANAISQADAVLACPNLVHAGLAYNRITTLAASTPPTLSCSAGSSMTGRANASVSTAGGTLRAARPAALSGRLSSSVSRASTSVSKCSSSSRASTHPLLAASQLISLDLSHNDISDLPSILQQLKQLPKLRALSLRGNPVSLLPHCKAAVLQQLPQLVYLDGQKLDDLRAMPAAPPSGAQPSTSAPSTVAPAVPAVVPAPAAAQKLAPTAPTPPAPPATAVGDAAVAEAARTPGNTVLITLELHKLHAAEPAAGVFQALTEGALVQLQRLLTEHRQLQQQQQQAQAQERPSAAGEQQSDTAAACRGFARSSSSSGSGSGSGSGSSSSSCPDTARSLPASSAGGGVSSSRGVSSSGAVGGGCDSCSADASQVVCAVPLLPLRYHLEACGPDGAGFCSAAVLVHPPAAAGEGGPAADAAGPSTVSAVEAKKGAAAKGAKSQDSKAAAPAAAANKGRPGAPVKPAGVAGKGAAAAAALEAQQAAVEAPPELQPGQLNVQLCVPADVATRDWLRTGFEVKLRRTHHQPQPVLQRMPADLQRLQQPEPTQAAATAAAAPAAVTPPAAAPSSKAGGSHSGAKAGGKGASSSSSGSTQPAGRAKSSGGAAAAAAAATQEGAELSGPAVEWQQVLQQADLGTARVCAPALVEESSRVAGQMSEVTGAVDFAPPAPLLHPASHVRLALTAAQQLQQQQQQPASGCAFKLILHG